MNAKAPLRLSWLVLLATTAVACDGETAILEEALDGGEFESAADLSEEVAFDPADNSACMTCHPSQARSWQGSLHQRAWIEPAFQESYTREPLEFCRGCHAPRADPELPPPPEAARLGVDCVSCHVGEDARVHTGPTGSAADDAPHDVVRSEDFGEESCGGCHQFEFPRKSHRRPGALMQKTLVEHDRSEWSDLACSDCHFPRDDAGTVSDHGLSISRNEDLLRNALSAEVSRIGPQTVHFELEPIGVGHSFPTGDLFRRIELRVEVQDASGRILERKTRYLARQFASISDGHGFIPEEADQRLHGPTAFELELERAEAKHRLMWQVTYQRVDSRDHANPARSKLAGEVSLAAGVLGP